MWFDFFKKKKRSAETAKERLQVILAYERAANSTPFLEDMKKDLLQVISKYIKIDPSTIKINLEKDESMEILEINIPIK